MLVYDDGTVKQFRGDCLKILMDLPTASVDAVITDSPYSSGGAYRGDRMQSVKTKYVQTGQETDHGAFAGDKRDQRSYSYWCALWLSECLRITKPGGPCCLFSDWRQLPSTTDAIQAGGWVWRGIAAWDKTEGVRPMKGRYCPQCEFVVWGSNGPMPVEGPVLPGCWRFASGVSQKEHIAGKPVALMAEVIRICKPGGVILDPFSGSGSTLKAAKESGRKAIGIDIEAYWADRSGRRVSQDMLNLGELA